MSGYAEMSAEANRRRFVARWVPDEEAKKLQTNENTRWWLARARAAEAELEELKAALRMLKGATR